MELVKNNNKLSVKNLLPAYKADIRIFENWLGSKPITPDTITEYFVAMGETKKTATLGRAKVSLKAAILQSRGAAVQLGEKQAIEYFFKNIKLPKRDLNIKKDNCLNKKEYQTLLKIAPRKTALLIESLYETAGRVSELLNVKLDDCTIKNKGVEIFVVGKGNKEGTFFMTLELYNRIRETYQGQTFLFENKKTGNHISRHTAFRLIKNAGKKIKRPDLHPHSLRHTWGTFNVPEFGIYKVSKYMRHSNILVTEKFYCHAAPEMNEILAMNEFIKVSA